MMNQFNLQNEENFWPCVSDMFLALFIIALVLYSTASKKEGEGDIKFARQTIVECEGLVRDLQRIIPGDELSDMKVPEESHENRTQPELAAMLCSLQNCKSLEPAFPNKQIATDEELGDYDKAILMLYRATATSDSDREPPEDCYTPDARVRKLKSRILDKLEIGKISPEEKLRRLQEELAEKEKKIRQLETDLAELREIVAKTPDVEELLARQRELDAQIRKLKEKHASVLIAKDNIINELQRRLNSDPRTIVMQKVREILKRHGLDAKLNSGDIEVEDDLGLVRVKSSVVSFRQKVYKKFTGLKELALLAEALQEIAEQDKDDKLINNIVIECHADTDGDAFENEELSANRALYIWKYLDGSTQGELAKHKNSKGLGLFSHAGFGCRVPLPLEMGESPYSDAYKTRCRRIDIRFNCNPYKGELTNK